MNIIDKLKEVKGENAYLCKRAAAILETFVFAHTPETDKIACDNCIYQGCDGCYPDECNDWDFSEYSEERDKQFRLKWREREENVENSSRRHI